MRLDPIRLLRDRPVPRILSKACLSSAFFHWCFLSQQFRPGILGSGAQTWHLYKLTKTIHCVCRVTVECGHCDLTFPNTVQMSICAKENIKNLLVLFCLNSVEVAMQQKPVEALIVFNISFTKLKVRITEHTDWVISQVFTNIQKQLCNIVSATSLRMSVLCHTFCVTHILRNHIV